MIKIFPLLLSVFCLFAMPEVRADVLDEVRKNYSKMASNEDLCKTAMANLSEIKDHSATHLAYLGGLQTIWANHTLNPLSKLSTFKKRKKI